MAREAPAAPRLWRHADFLRLWSGQTISAFGSMVGGTAMSFTALLVLRATPFQMALLQAMQLAPAFLAGLFAGAWVDRLRRRPLMIGADIGRAIVLATIPLAALLDALRIEQVYGVALLVSILTIVFDLAYQSYLPGLVGRQRIVEGNSKLSASAAVSEFGGFSLGGWLVQLLTAPLAILVDAASFLVSALSLGLIRARETVQPPEAGPDMLGEIRQGLSAVRRAPLLAASASVTALENLASGMYGALVVLYMGRELGFAPGILGMIWAVGGVSSFLGASFTPRLTRRLQRGPAMALGLAAYGLGTLFVPLASGATLLAAVFLILQQLGDGFYVLYDINLLSFRQELVPERLLGRVNATLRFLAMGTTLAGTLLGGALGETLGVRPTLVLASGGLLLAAAFLVLSPLSKLRHDAVS